MEIEIRMDEATDRFRTYGPLTAKARKELMSLALETSIYWLPNRVYYINVHNRPNRGDRTFKFIWEKKTQQWVGYDVT